jgi:malate synthase
MKKVSTTVGRERFEAGKFNQAQSLFETLSTANEFEEFLTLPAYEQLVSSTLSGTIQE